MSEPTAPSNPTSQPVASTSSEGDWTDQVTALIVDTIDKVRSKTTGPILEVSKGMVYAVVALMLAVPIVVLFLQISPFHSAFQLPLRSRVRLATTA